LRRAAAVENHRGGDHWSGKRPAACLVDSGDDPRVAPFVREIGHRDSRLYQRFAAI
jgi:hypothetical protein